jgi:4-amino-4-deoxy-L-arabinose transferase-like glycosyltransferase
MLTTVLGILFFKIGVMDSLLTLFETVATIAGYRALHATGRGKLLNWLACYAATALAILTKGPVALVAVGLVLLCYGLLNRREVASGGVGMHIIGLALAALVVGAWLVPAVLKGGSEYANVILFRQQVGRVLNYYGHKNPFYFFAATSPGYFFPWALIWPLAAIAAFRSWRNDRAGNSERLLLALWCRLSSFRAW